MVQNLWANRAAKSLAMTNAAKWCSRFSSPAQSAAAAYQYRPDPLASPLDGYRWDRWPWLCLWTVKKEKKSAIKMEKGFECCGWDKNDGRAAHTDPFNALVLYADVHFWRMRQVTLTPARCAPLRNIFTRNVCHLCLTTTTRRRIKCCANCERFILYGWALKGSFHLTQAVILHIWC